MKCFCNMGITEYDYVAWERECTCRTEAEQSWNSWFPLETVLK